MQTPCYATMAPEELDREIAGLRARIEQIKADAPQLNMARGKPGKEQIELALPVLSSLDLEAGLTASDGTDCTNYGCLMGLPEVRSFFGELLGAPARQVFVGGVSSLTLMHDVLAHGMIKGFSGCEPWVIQMKERSLKWICLVPGYDRHFAITEYFGFEMIPVELGPDGPDVAELARLVDDPDVKGLWCVPVYSNPSGCVYSDAVIQGLAELKPAAPDFRILWDNAYVVHHLYNGGGAGESGSGTDSADASGNAGSGTGSTGQQDSAPDTSAASTILDCCRDAGNPDLVLAFCSTSKVTIPGAGVAAMACSEGNMAELEPHLDVQTIGHDKINQLRHINFLKDRAGLDALMRQHARHLRPRFELVERRLHEAFDGTGIARWTTPHGGYFVMFWSLPGCARRIVQLAQDCGVTLTGAGLTWPYARDPHDSDIRIAPTFPSLDELDRALAVFCTCVKLVTAEHIRGQAAGSGAGTAASVSGAEAQQA